MSDGKGERWLSIERQQLDGIKVWAGDVWPLDQVTDVFEAAIAWMHEVDDPDALEPAARVLYQMVYELVYEPSEEKS